MPLAIVAGLLLVAACDPEPRAAEQGSDGPAAAATPETDPAAALDAGASGLASAPPGAAPDRAPWTMPAVPEVIADGIRVYRANYCGTCHRSTLAGTAGIFGPGHDSMAVYAARRLDDPGYTGRATTPAEYVRESIVDPVAWRVPGYERTRFLMPAYTQLTHSEVDALVRMLLWQPSAEGGH